MGPKTFKTEDDARNYLRRKGAAVIIDEDEPNFLYGYDKNYALIGAAKFKDFSETSNPFYS